MLLNCGIGEDSWESLGLQGDPTSPFWRRSVLEGLMLKVKLHYFGHLMQRADSVKKTLMLGGIGDRRRRGQQRMRWLDGIADRWMWVWVNSGGWWWTGRPGVLRFMGLLRVRQDWATELNWTELIAHFWGFPCCSDDKESACNAGDLGSIHGLGRSPGGGHGNPLQYSCLENLHGQRSLAGYSPWCHKELDTTEWLKHST